MRELSETFSSLKRYYHLITMTKHFDKDLNKTTTEKIRVGGMVKKNTLKIKDQEIRFIITDFKNEINVSFQGTIPNLFAEGKGVVAEGKLQDKKFFVADRILAKHDENYMPTQLKNIRKEKETLMTRKPKSL